MTEREIEARLEQGTKTAQDVPQQAPEPDPDMDTLRRYLAATVEVRAEIDRLAEERARPLLATLSADKHAGIIQQARVEVAREYFEER